jgi:hypothetical protein
MGQRNAMPPRSKKTSPKQPSLKQSRDLAKLLGEIKACCICADVLDHEPRPVVRLKASVKLCIVGQTPACGFMNRVSRSMICRANACAIGWA